MKCPFCLATDTKVLDSRSLEDGFSIRRRRKCENCQKRFTTYESIEVEMPKVVKTDGRREDFSKEKIAGGINKACQKLAISTAQIEHVIQSIEKNILETADKEITTKQIGKIVMGYLRALDPVAFVRFASVYCNFRDIDEFFHDLKLEDEAYLPSKKKFQESIERVPHDH